MRTIMLEIEVLEKRIAADSIHGVPGESNGNPGNEMSNGAKPQPGSHIRTAGVVSRQTPFLPSYRGWRSPRRGVMEALGLHGAQTRLVWILVFPRKLSF